MAQPPRFAADFHATGTDAVFSNGDRKPTPSHDGDRVDAPEPDTSGDYRGRHARADADEASPS
ncbi:hypothetical protein LO763_20180 [Glycomyces sp. A-F 0318]|uniref:hypothetical protein n=1 Tax=Glycomyces amatae TaxID=2881355 RepID=UPI001E317837|nr:hypothetical protein [Glycomyces amatae]MCD0445933.1 hypothetical protein [Glycomyces amatae]